MFVEFVLLPQKIVQFCCQEVSGCMSKWKYTFPYLKFEKKILEIKIHQDYCKTKNVKIKYGGGCSHTFINVA